MRFSTSGVWVLMFVLTCGNLTALAETPSATALNRLSRQEIEAGWIQLFDGESLFGWKPNTDVNWTVKDGVIHASEGKSGLLVTTTEFADYELRCDFRMAM